MWRITKREWVPENIKFRLFLSFRDPYWMSNKIESKQTPNSHVLMYQLLPYQIWYWSIESTSSQEKCTKKRSLLTDLSKAFDCLSLDWLIAKLHSYGISLASLKLLTDYLTNRKQRTKIETSYSSWEDIKHGVPKGSILGPLLINIFVCDMFLMLDHTYFATYADDNAPYAVNENAE